MKKEDKWILFCYLAFGAPLFFTLALMEAVLEKSLEDAALIALFGGVFWRMALWVKPAGKIGNQQGGGL